MFDYFKKKIRANKQRKKLLLSKTFFDFNTIDFSNKNVLLIDEIVPEYNKDSGSRRLTTIIKLLLENKVTVFLMADYKQHKYKSDYLNYFKELGVIVYEPALDKSNKLITKNVFLKNIMPHISATWLHRPRVFSKYFKTIKALNSKTEIIFDMCDFHYLRLKREWEQKGDVALKIEAEKNLKQEIEICKKADKIIAITHEDLNAILPFYNVPEKFEVVSNIHQYVEKPSNFPTFELRNDLLFVGNFRHSPNEDALLYLHDKIMPLIWAKHPEVNVQIVGSYPTDKVKALHSERFIVHGFVDSIVDFFYNSKVFIAPLRYGAGIKGKIGQSLEYSLPVVTTKVGAEGFDFGPFKNQLIAETPEDLASKLIELYTNKNLWQEVSAYSETILQPFSTQVTEKNILRAIN
jgi:hypoxanthine phosphoribosyltransferase